MSSPTRTNSAADSSTISPFDANAASPSLRSTSISCPPWRRHADCAGVALGFDRLVAIALNANRLSDALSFSIDNA